MNFIWLDAADYTGYLYTFLIGINIVFFKKSGKIYQIFTKYHEKFIYYITFSQEISVPGIINLITISLL